MLTHHPTVRDHCASRRLAKATTAATSSAPQTTRPAKLTTQLCNQLHESSTLLERQRICTGGVHSFPLYSSRIPLPYTLPGVNDVSCLMSDAYRWNCATVTPPVVGRSDVTARNEVAALSAATPVRQDIAATLSTRRRDSPPSPPTRFSSQATAVVTPNIEVVTATPRHIADSGIANCRRRQRATADRTLLRRSFTFAADRCSSDDDSSTGDEHTAAPSSSTSSTEQPRYSEVNDGADSASLPTSDSAYSDADEVPDTTQNQ